MKEQIQHDDDDDDTQIYIYKTLTDTAMMVRFFLSPQGFNFSDIYIHTHLQNTLSGDENNFGPVRICFKCKLPNMLIQQLHTWMSDEMFSAESVTLIASDVSALAS